MKKLIIFICLGFSLTGFSQSFVFCPHVDNVRKQGFDSTEVAIVFNDSRVYSKKKVREQCYSEQIFGEFVNSIRKTYPKMHLTVLDEKLFATAPERDIVTIKIKLTTYETVGAGSSWNARIEYHAQIFDYSKAADSLSEQTIKDETKAVSWTGYGDGMNATDKNFKKAFDKFLVMLDNHASSPTKRFHDQKHNSPTNNQQTKADRLRDLKKLLDEKILTQEEYDAEKKKILNEKE